MNTDFEIENLRIRLDAVLRLCDRADRRAAKASPAQTIVLNPDDVRRAAETGQVPKENR